MGPSFRPSPALTSPRPSPDPARREALGQAFYARPAPVVARQLLGKVLELRGLSGCLAAVIVETEAYLSVDDPASHAHRGLTPRSRIMFGPPGFAYVYLIYGMYHCLNAVTEAEGTASAVLIRALDPNPVGGGPTGLRREALNGPGKLCRELGIDLSMNGWDLSRSDLRILDGGDLADAEVVVGPRVGISRAADLQLRFRRG